jgi:hypothetical protein
MDETDTASIATYIDDDAHRFFEDDLMVLEYHQIFSRYLFMQECNY